MTTPYVPSEMLTQLLGLRARHGLDTTPHTYLALERAARQETSTTFSNRYGRPCGYVAWARLNKEAFLRFRQNGALPKNIWEWNEGNLVVIADCVCRQLGIAELRKQLRGIFGRARVIAYQRNGRLKIWSRRNMRFHLAAHVLIEKIATSPALNKRA